MESSAAGTPRHVAVTRYVTPLREGGSLPAIVEADDDGLYVVKFRGAGQGPKALIAELLAGAIGRALGLPVPEIVFIDLDASLGAAEPDPEIHDLLVASSGLNLGIDYLPGSLSYDPASSPPPTADIASRIVWFDAYVMNVDRTARNTNLLTWHRSLWLIDHGASLYFHHDWAGGSERAASPFAAIKDHVLLPFASGLEQARAELVPRLSDALLEAVVSLIPDAWVVPWSPEVTPAAVRAAYHGFLCQRRDAAGIFTEEAIRARG